MIENVAFTAVWENNINVTTPNNLAKVTLTGMNNFTGTRELEFAINPKPIDGVILATNFTHYNMQDQSALISPIVFAGQDILIEDNDYVISFYRNYVEGLTTVETEDFTSAGIITIVVEGINNYGGTKQAIFTIAAKNIADMDVVVEGLVKNIFYQGGREIKQDLTITFNDYELVEDEDFSISYEDNVNVGLATITITAKAGGNFEGYRTLNFTINKVKPYVNPVIEDKTYFVGDALPEITLSEGDTEGTIFWIEDITILAGEQLYSFNFIPTDTRNYDTYSSSIMIVGTPVVIEEIAIKDFTHTTYTAYDKFSTEGAYVEATYNNGTKRILEEEEYVFSIPEETELTVDDNIVIVVTPLKEDLEDSVEITVNPVELNVEFGEKKDFIENEEIQFVELNVEGLIENHDAEIVVEYINQETDDVSYGFVESGVYTVRVTANNRNYKIMNESEIEIHVRVGIITSEDGKVTVISELGFDNDVRVTLTEVEGDADLRAVLGNFRYQTEKVYIVQLWKGDEEYKPDFDMTIRIKTEARILNNDALKAYMKLLSSPNFSKIDFTVEDNDYAEFKTNTTGVFILSTANTSVGVSGWLYILVLGLVGGISVMFGVLEYLRRKHRARRLIMQQQEMQDLIDGNNM